MKKIFIITGEPSGDKLASTVISKLKMQNPDIEYLSVGGAHIKKLGIQSIFDLNQITYLGFTSVLFNIFKIRNKINLTVDQIIKFNPDILFSVDSPDFTLRVAEKVKKINNKIKTIHYVAPQVWVWRKNRVKKIKRFIDHMILLFKFEKKYFDEENISNTFVGHPLIEKNDNVKTVLNDLISKDKKIISIFPGSRKSETHVLLPILLDFIKLMNKKEDIYSFVLHATDENKEFIINHVKKTDLNNIDVISDENIKSQILSNSIFAVSKSGTVSLEICNAKIPSIILYKMNFLNFLIIKMLVKTKYANIINIAAKEEIIPELLQSNCNAENIYKYVNDFIDNPEKIKTQITKFENILKDFKTEKSSSELASLSLSKFL